MIYSVQSEKETNFCDGFDYDLNWSEGGFIQFMATVIESSDDLLWSVGKSKYFLFWFRLMDADGVIWNILLHPVNDENLISSFVCFEVGRNETGSVIIFGRGVK